MAKDNKPQLEAQDWYISSFKQFENQLNGGAALPVHKVRKSAIDAFSKIGFPNTRFEDWKYTNISPLLKERFELAQPVKSPAKDAISRFLFKGIEDNLIVFVNGFYSESLSTIHKQEGVTISNIQAALEHHAELVGKHLTKHLNYENQTFPALNTAFLSDGVFIHVAKNVVAKKPLHILYIADASQQAFQSHPRNLVVLERSSELHIVESHTSLDGGSYFNNAGSEFVIDENATLEHVKVQDDSTAAFHFATVQANVARNANFNSINVDLGGGITRNNLNVEFTGENAQASLIGFYYATGNQLVDNHTFIDHAVPHCESNELYKGFLGGKSSGVFNGRVLVRPDAQKTNAFQQNQALLLTKDATIDSKPELEIFADDVLCSHGATIGELDEDQLLYLRTRGISKDMAQAMLRIAFANDIFERIKIDAVREKLEADIIQRFQS